MRSGTERPAERTCKLRRSGYVYHSTGVACPSWGQSTGVKYEEAGTQADAEAR
jgi:hypothetical protein